MKARVDAFTERITHLGVHHCTGTALALHRHCTTITLENAERAAVAILDTHHQLDLPQLHAELKACEQHQEEMRALKSLKKNLQKAKWEEEDLKVCHKPPYSLILKHSISLAVTDSDSCVVCKKPLILMKTPRGTPWQLKWRSCSSKFAPVEMRFTRYHSRT